MFKHTNALTECLYIFFFSFSVAVCRFPNTGDDWYVLVGVARDMILNPKSAAGGFIYTYRLIGGGEKLEFMHKVGLTHQLDFHFCFGLFWLCFSFDYSWHITYTQLGP